MGTQRKRYSTELKARVALEAIKEQKTVNEIAGQYGVHPNLVGKWKKQLKEESSRIFAEPNRDRDAAEETLKASLYQQIGQLKVELDWLKKKSGLGE